MKNNFTFGTKAETLSFLKDKLKRSTIPDLFIFTVEEWLQNQDSIINQIKKRFKSNDLVAIRSSALNEDGLTEAMAGAFHSSLNVDISDLVKLEKTIKEVIHSYKKSDLDLNNQIFIQKMVTNVSMSGVVFTKDMMSGAPYYVINYDDQSGLTDTVTSGKNFGNRTLYVFREKVSDLRSDRFVSLLASINELEHITKNNMLDIEFAIDNNLNVHILQVRSISTHDSWDENISNKVSKSILEIKKFVKESYKPKPDLFGTTSLFTQMSDWNPAEIIGTAPRPLAFSLYKYLITDKSWHVARERMGYVKLTDSPLMVSLSGVPFIDVRLSFNSLLPKQLEANISNKLVNHWLNSLKIHNALHDKIEFEVAMTALSFDFEYSYKKLIGDILTLEEKSKYKKNLHKLTDDLLNESIAPISQQLDKINKLKVNRESYLDKKSKPDIELISLFLDDCIENGTIPFSILARHAFIAKSFMRSLVVRKVLTENELNDFQNSIKTVASDFLHKLEKLSYDKSSFEEFLLEYGHLRPGTYDILSKRYDMRVDMLKELSGKKINSKLTKAFSFSSDQIKSIEKLCGEFDFKITPSKFIKYMIEATSAREFSKFEFTKNLSDVIEIIAKWGEFYGFDREDLSYLNINDILKIDNSTDISNKKNFLQNKIDQSRDRHLTTKAINLPHVINSSKDVSIIPLLIARPNFITRKVINGSAIRLDGYSQKSNDLKDKIVIIENADPGFDWIFACSIKGLITKFGGVNSHMAIRCAEFNLPAAIGCGEQIYNLVINSSAVEINCSEELISVAETNNGKEIKLEASRVH